MWGRKINFADAVAFKKEHPKAKFLDRITGLELLLGEKEFEKIDEALKIPPVPEKKEPTPVPENTLQPKPPKPPKPTPPPATPPPATV